MKKNVCVIFGGLTLEYDISCETARSIVGALSSEKYNVFILGITQNGIWRLFRGPIEEFSPEDWEANSENAYISPLQSHHGIVLENEIIYIDLVFISVHGKWGEDGALQGLLELAQIPYIGTSILGSAIGYNKVFFKKMIDAENLPQAKWTYLGEAECNELIKTRSVSNITNILEFPIFVKPAQGGSSQGISLCNKENELISAIETALKIDTTIVFEEKVACVEIDCAIISSEKEYSFLPLAKNNYSSIFFDYDAKYVNEDTEIIIPAKLSIEIEKRIKEIAIKLIKTLSLKGLCRIDFFVEYDTEKVFINEINTQPGIASEDEEVNIWKTDGKLQKTIDLIIETSI